MNWQKGIKVTTYRGPRTGFKLEVIVSNEGEFGSTYREATIFRDNGKLVYNITDGYEWLQPTTEIRDNLKSAINIIAGKIAPTPYYAKG